MQLSEIIKNYRTEHNISIRDLANKTNLSSGYIHTLEKGVDPRTNKPIAPTVDTINKLSIGMNIPASELLLSAGLPLGACMSNAKLNAMQQEMVDKFTALVLKEHDHNETFYMFLELDTIDKAEIKGEIRQMLKADKYKKETLHA